MRKNYRPGTRIAHVNGKPLRYLSPHEAARLADAVHIARYSKREPKPWAFPW